MMKILTVSIAGLAIVALSFSTGCSKSGGDPIMEMHNHTKAIFKILKDNTSDCAKAVTEVKSYADKNKDALAKLAKQLKEMEEKASKSEEEKKKLEDRKQKLSESMLKESMATMMEFGQKCPQQMQEIAVALKDFGPKK